MTGALPVLFVSSLLLFLTQGRLYAYRSVQGISQAMLIARVGLLRFRNAHDAILTVPVFTTDEHVGFISDSSAETRVVDEESSHETNSTFSPNGSLDKRRARGSGRPLSPVLDIERDPGDDMEKAG
jgi:hypothetical protein